MDNFEEIKPELQEDAEVDALWITEDIRSYIYDAAKWTRFLSIVGFVLTAMFVMSAFSVGAMLSTLGTTMPGNPMLKLGSTVWTVIYLLFALLQFYPSLLLYKFSKSATQAVLFADQPSLGEAMGKLKSFFKFWGILTIVIIALYILMIVVFVASGGQAAA
ncbi:hypothetical protein HDF26_005380 [Pedobacter cryoconitis]|uniref:Uncharacterized protein n=1 Tax=Pedobacter cryoconitis TaxID=188932 RepID=A0A7W8ZS10_9SPHI|nr:DUF5362 family protein [Pedobacter cryoconitis]MBB5639132.1 hypothetical protein [Pedobacter cryoconitis]MBB6274894.1 hypothetical protein [Pedobacter cryoconitis]